MEMTLQMLDPAEVLVDMNVRLTTKADAELVQSVTDFGVLQPVAVTRTAEGKWRCRLGNRRTLAAATAGVGLPAVVVGDESQDDEAQILRVLHQMAENLWREPLTQADVANGIQLLFDLGVPAAQIAKRTQLDEEIVEAAHKVAKSPKAMELAAGQMDLVQAAAASDFADDEEIIAELTEIIEEGGDELDFKHRLQYHRDRRDRLARLEVAAEKLRADGLTVVTDQPPWELAVRNFADDEGKRFTEESHASCPGNVLYLREIWREGEPAVMTDAYCGDPKGNGHKNADSNITRSQRDQVADPEAAAAERKRVIQGNRDWKSACTVRREWIRDKVLKLKTPPKGAVRWAILELARHDWSVMHEMSDRGGPEMAMQLMGVEPGKGALRQEEFAPLVAVASTGTEGRAQLVLLALVLGAHEAPMLPTHGGQLPWRSYDDKIRRYFEALETWGYKLSAIEKTAIKPPRALRSVRAKADAPAEDDQSGTD